MKVHMDSADHTLAIVAQISGERKAEVLRHKLHFKELTGRCEEFGRQRAGEISPLIALETAIEFSVQVDSRFRSMLEQTMHGLVQPEDIEFLATAFNYGRLHQYLCWYYPDKVKEFENNYKKGMERRRQL